MPHFMLTFWRRQPTADRGHHHRFHVFGAGLYFFQFGGDLRTIMPIRC
jgi:hypothetical protein